MQRNAGTSRVPMTNEQKQDQLTPYEQGYRAYNERAGLSSNPFPSDSKEHEQWFNGWMQNDREETLNDSTN